MDNIDITFINISLIVEIILIVSLFYFPLVHLIIKDNIYSNLIQIYVTILGFSIVGVIYFGRIHDLKEKDMSYSQSIINKRLNLLEKKLKNTENQIKERPRLFKEIEAKAMLDF